MWMILGTRRERRRRDGRAILAVLAVALPLGLLGQPSSTNPDVSSRLKALAETADTIRGRVVSDSGQAIIGAEIIVTMAPDRTFQSARSDSSGRYMLVFPMGSGDYLVHISAAGRVTFRKRVTRAGSESVLVVDATLVIARGQLATVTVRATRPTPVRTADPGTEVGAAEKLVDGVGAAVPSAFAGDLAVTASTVPGVTANAGGISVLGLGAQQNSTTLDGMAFNGAQVPRSAQVRVGVASTKYDPAIGWFSGANTNLSFAGGNVFSSRWGYVTADVPALQYADPIAARLGQRFSNVSVDLGGSGPVTAADKYFYSYGVRAGHRDSDLSSLLSADPELLQHAGVAADSVTRLLQLLGAARVPLSLANAPGRQTSDNFSFLARLDRSPYDWNTFIPSRTTVGLTTFGSYSKNGPISLGPTVTPAHGGDRRQWSAGFGALYSAYFRKDVLTDARSTFSYSAVNQEPYLRLPAGTVLVSSRFPDGTDGISALEFGGNATIASEVRQWTWETRSETQVYAPGRALHRIKLTADARLDGQIQNSTRNPLGSFYFNSLGDLAANRPALYMRTLKAPAQSGAVWNGFMALGDLWRVTPRLRVQYGARVEGNVFTDRPAYNPAIARVFGARTDVAPESWHVSPRLGFTWVLGGGANNGAIRFTPIGVFNMGPTSYLRGGIGEFRNMLPAALLAGASGSTGLPTGLQTINCLGPAAPTPDWSAYAIDASSVPAQCVDGASNNAFTDRTPSVQLFDRSYTAPRSWRGNLSYASQYKKLMYGIDATYSLNLNQPGAVDLNFRNAPRFVLADEARPVFVAPGAIVPASGFVTTGSSRIDSTFAQVINNRADLRSVSRQLIVRLEPDLFAFSNWLVSVSYILADVRALRSGFDASTFGSPVDRAWARADLDVRQTVQAQAGISKGNVALTLFGRLMSGLPFTPMVGGDVNGDGLANDRAFIFDPARVSDAKLGSDLRTLVAGAPSGVRRCLERQRGMSAAVNSCEGPWTASLNMMISFNGKLFHAGNRLANVNLNFSNPLGGLDQLLHGADKLRGWGTQPFPDPVLYHVRGFDPTSNRFLYEVN